MWLGPLNLPYQLNPQKDSNKLADEIWIVYGTAYVSLPQEMYDETHYSVNPVIAIEYQTLMV